jgi:type III pantothenate kinase
VKLFVDLGNSRLKWAIGEYPGSWHDAGSCDIATIETLLQETWGAMAPPQEVWLSDVGAASVLARLEQWFAGHWSLTVRRLVAGTSCCGVSNGYREPAALGSDRWAAMIGAREMAAASAFCVVDCGTAATVDAVDANGRFVGGAILAGLAMSRRALVADTAAITPTAMVEASTPFANDTTAAVEAGTRYGLAGAADRLLDEAVVTIGPVRVFVTGGDGERIAPLLRRPVELVPDLVLRGLAVAAGQG